MKFDRLRNNKTIHLTYDFIMCFLFKINPKMATRIFFRISMGYSLSLKYPKTFNEKINWLKFNDNQELKTKCADKILVRDYLKEKGYENILNDIYCIYNCTDEIDFDKLPKSFVLKTNHSCGTNIIVNDIDKLNKDEALVKLNKWLKTKYGIYPYEPQYFNIKPRILCEKNLCDDYNEVPEDYKFYCSQGELLMFSIIVRPPKPELPQIYHYDINKKFIETNSRKDGEIPKVPNNIDEMIKIAKDLSKDFKFVRVDLYDFDDNEIKFGELTFTPTGGFYNYISKGLDFDLGSKIVLK